MLILTRRFGQKIRIGDDIEIVLLDSKIKSNNIRVGISAPPDMPVHREEIYNKIKNQVEEKTLDSSVLVTYKKSKLSLKN